MVDFKKLLDESQQSEKELHKTSKKVLHRTHKFANLYTIKLEVGKKVPYTLVAPETILGVMRDALINKFGNEWENCNFIINKMELVDIDG